MATINTRQYMRPRKGRSGFDLLHAADTPEDAARLAAEGYNPTDPDTARAAVTYNSRGWAQGEDAYRLGLKDRPVEVTIGTPPMLWRKEYPKDEDWGDGKRGGMTGATGRELDAAGMLGTGDEVEVREGQPQVLSRTPAMDQDWGDAKRSGASTPRAAGRPGLQVSPSSRSAEDATYLQRLSANAAPLQGREGAAQAKGEKFPFSDEELDAMFPEPKQGALPQGYAAEDYDPTLSAAQEQARQGRIIAAIGRAGAHFNETLSGAKYDRAAYDGYARDAERPVGDLLQRREAVAQRQGRARQAQQDRMRAEEHVANLRRQRAQDARQADAEAYRRKRDTIGDERYKAEQTESARRFGLQRADAAAERAYRRGRDAEEKTAREEQKREAARLKSEAQTTEAGQKRAEKLGQATTKAPYGELQQALQSLEEIAPGLIYGQDPAENPLSVKDRLANGLPFGAGDRFISDKGIQYKSALQNLRDLITRARTGAAMSDQEERHYLRLLGDDILSDPRRAAAGINEVRQGIAKKLRDAQLAYTGPTLDAYESGGGTTYRNPVFGAAPPKRQGPVRVQSPDGRTGTIDPSEVEEAVRNGWKVL